MRSLFIGPLHGFSENRDGPYPTFSSPFSVPATNDSYPSTTASASISTSQLEPMKRTTCMMVFAGRMLLKNSPWTAATPFPILNSGQQNSGAGHIGKLAAQSFNC